MKKLIEKKYLIGIIFLFVSIIILVLLKFNWQDKSDFKIGIITDSGLKLISISPERKMINVLKTNEDVPIWIPGGLGWYKSSSVKKILDQENKNSEVSDIFFYNFGFTPEKWYLSNKDNWKGDIFLLKSMGFLKWIKYKVESGEMIIKEEVVNKNLAEEEFFLEDIMARDFADSRLVNEELKVSIINTTSESGLAAFIGRNLEWAGFSIISMESVNEKVKNCLFLSGDKAKDTYGWLLLKQIFNCDIRDSSELEAYDVELYFGDEYAQMLKYSNYSNY